jgi:hypothetical protein
MGAWINRRDHDVGHVIADFQHDSNRCGIAMNNMISRMIPGSAMRAGRARLSDGLRADAEPSSAPVRSTSGPLSELKSALSFALARRGPEDEQDVFATLG